MNKTHSRFTPTLPCDLGKLPDGSPCEIGVSLMNPTVVSETLCHYEDLKKHCIDRPNSDLWAYMQTFDDLFETALRQEPFLYTIARTKIAGYTNQEVQEALEKEFQTSYTQQYISTLWRKKIPALIASAAEDEFLSWYYLEIEKGKYKKCSCCGQIKLALPKYFARNPSSKDGFYSLCKVCRSERRRKTTSPGKTILKTTPKIQNK